jgi:hypothetical protein
VKRTVFSPGLPLTIWALTLVATGCASFVIEPERPAHRFRERPAQACETEHGEVLVGVALSGGGSRAGLFAAGGLEALARLHEPGDRCSILERVTHISSVSGGSVAASYLGAKKPAHGTPVIESGVLHPEYETFFDGFEEAMRTNFWKSTQWRQCKKFRWLNPSKRAKSLADVLDRLYLDQMTLADLNRREADGDIPVLIFNSTWYNSGKRFAISSLPETAFEYDLGDARLDASTPEGLGVDLSGMHVSTAVAASASVPWLFGPVTFRVPGGEEDEPTYWHAGDGGLSDNQGIETLSQVLLHELGSGGLNGPRQAVIIALDGSQPFSTGASALASKRNKKYVDPSHMLKIMEQRAQAYNEMVWRAGKRRAPFDRLSVVLLRYHEAQIGPADLPASCQGKKFDLDTAEKIRERLAMLPTRFKIRTPCDADLILMAADDVVRRRAPEILKLLRPPVREDPTSR